MKFLFDVEVVLDEHRVAHLCQQLEDCLEASQVCGVVRGGVFEIVVESKSMHFGFAIDYQLYYIILYVKNTSAIRFSTFWENHNRSVFNI